MGGRPAARRLTGRVRRLDEEPPTPTIAPEGSPSSGAPPPAGSAPGAAPAVDLEASRARLEARQARWSAYRARWQAVRRARPPEPPESSGISHDEPPPAT